jgi:hypothetical protein
MILLEVYIKITLAEEIGLLSILLSPALFLLALFFLLFKKRAIAKYIAIIASVLLIVGIGLCNG